MLVMNHDPPFRGMGCATDHEVAGNTVVTASLHMDRGKWVTDLAMILVWSAVGGVVRPVHGTKYGSCSGG